MTLDKHVDADLFWSLVRDLNNGIAALAERGEALRAGLARRMVADAYELYLPDRIPAVCAAKQQSLCRAWMANVVELDNLLQVTRQDAGIESSELAGTNLPLEFPAWLVAALLEVAGKTNGIILPVDAKPRSEQAAWLAKIAETTECPVCREIARQMLASVEASAE